MNLLKLTINNFKGIEHLEIAPEGTSVSVYGENATGKTTIADALCWLLFNKGYDKVSFSPKTLKDGQEVHNIDIEVEAEFALDSGEKIALKKVYSEVYKKKRGAATADFTGHTTNYFISGVPAQEKEFNDYLNSIMPAYQMQLLSIPYYFPTVLSVATRRELLMSIIGNVDDETVINSNEILKPLNTYLLKPGSSDQKYTVDDIMRIAKNRNSDINQQLKMMPARIDEANRALPDITGAEDAEKKLCLLKVELTKQNDRKNANKNEKKSELNAQITEKTAKLKEYESDYKIKSSNVNAETDRKISTAKSQHSNITLTISSVNNSLAVAKRELETLNQKRAQTLAEYKKVSDQVYEGNNICPCCGQTLPDHLVEEAKAKFNEKKSNDLLKINQIGKQSCSKEMISQKEHEIAEYTNKLTDLNNSLAAFSEEINKLESQRKEPAPTNEMAEYINLTQEIEKLKTELTVANNNENESNSEINSKIAEIEAQIDGANKLIALRESHQKQHERIENLKNEQKKYASDYEKTSQIIFLCEEFIKTKVDMLTDSINSKFSNVKFRLFQQQINGGLKDDCTVLIPCDQGLIPYDTANDAAKVNAGLDIIRVLADYFKQSMPVIVDGAESVTHLKDNGLQVIRLVVSESDKTLRVERED